MIIFQITRDDWKALLDRVQRDRGHLQNECNAMEKELAEALENRKNAKRGSGIAIAGR